MAKKRPIEWFGDLIGAYGLPTPEREYQFDPGRKWRFDFAWPDRMLAVEIDGGGHFGRHHRVQGMAADMDKSNAAAIAGWTVLRFNTWHFGSDERRRAVGEFMERVVR